MKNCKISSNASNGNILLLERKYEEVFKANFKISNRNSYFLFNILVADIEIFSKNYKSAFG